MPDPDAPPFVTFLSDFGTADDFAGICHGVINLICPGAQVIHVTHGIQPQAIGQGARVLAGAIPYLPVGVRSAIFFLILASVGFQTLQAENERTRGFDPWDHERW